MDFAVPSEQKVWITESKKVAKFKKKNVTIIPIVINAVGIVTKGLLQGLENRELTVRLETIQTTAFLRSVRILRRVLETWGDLLPLKHEWETIS